MVERGAQIVPALARELSDSGPLLCGHAHALAVQHEDWTCGYANLGALLQCLSQQGRDNLPAQTDPPSLQRLVESAWREGFDPYSAGQFNHKLVGKRGYHGWIGAPEMLAVLGHLRVDAMIIEIILERGDADRATGRAVYAAVAACLAQHGETPAATAFPIVLQGDGHSRSILGITPRSAPTLIVRDPRDRQGVVRCLAPGQFDGKQFQLVIVRSARKLSKAQARKRFHPQAAASWRSGRWRYSDWCKLRMG